MSTSPGFMHNYALMQLTGAMWQWDQQANLGQTIPSAGIVFSEDVGVIPDALWISHERLPQILINDRLRGAPELVVEVLSPGAENLRRDRIIKLATYDRWGVDEYWIVSLTDRQIDQYRRVDGRLALVRQFGGADSLTTPLLPGFVCPLAKIFR